MKEIKVNGNRKLYHVPCASQASAIEGLKGKNWCALIYFDKFSAKTNKALIKTIVDAEPLFVYCVCSNFNDLEEMVVDELCTKFVDLDEEHDDVATPLTFADNDIKGAIKFCLESAFHDEKEIEEVYVLDGGEHELNAEVFEFLN
ncbi:MAG TPA: hypothetical protein VK177_08515 [Flavobacteriales bacterium]|nr:hypothetical protein [Flavobacteriales bacterium]